jgi:hypothetical protein
LVDSSAAVLRTTDFLIDTDIDCFIGSAAV